MDNNIIPYAREAKLLGLKFNRNNFYVNQVKHNTDRARVEQTKLRRFKGIQRKLKIRLYKTLILPILTYPVIPLNICSKTQIDNIQRIQNTAIRWITNEHWPVRCPIADRQRELKIEPIGERIQRLAKGTWDKIHDENSDFHRANINIQMQDPHSWYPSSYLRAYK